MTMQPVLEVRNLVTHYRSVERGKTIKAVDDVSLKVFPGEIVGLIGESGCGKSSLGRSIVGLAQPASGQVILNGIDLSTLRGSALRKTRSQIQYIFQDPYSSLNDRQTIGEALQEALTIAGVEDAARVSALLDQVGLPSALRDRYGRELSGGHCASPCHRRPPPPPEEPRELPPPAYPRMEAPPELRPAE